MEERLRNKRKMTEQTEIIKLSVCSVIFRSFRNLSSSLSPLSSTSAVLAKIAEMIWGLPPERAGEHQNYSGFRASAARDSSRSWLHRAAASVQRQRRSVSVGKESSRRSLFLRLDHRASGRASRSVSRSV